MKSSHALAWEDFLFYLAYISKNLIYISKYKSPVGELTLGSFKDKLCLCDWTHRLRRTAIDNRIRKGLQAEFKKGTSDIIKRTRQQLKEYFDGKRQEFDIPLLFVGTEFQKQVWNELLNIPFGKKLSYINLAKNLNNPDAVRAVAAANGANAISIIVPCHRVVGQNGSLVGYAGGLSAKKKLISIEGGVAQLTLF